MPNRDIHEIFTYILTQLFPGGATKGTAMHAAMDLPAAWMGPNHRAVNHDVWSILLLAGQQASAAALGGQGNFWEMFLQNVAAGLSHVALDEGVSAAKRLIGTAGPFDQSLAAAQAGAQVAAQRFITPNLPFAASGSLGFPPWPSFVPGPVPPFPPAPPAPPALPPTPLFQALGQLPNLKLPKPPKRGAK